jgi:ParB-like chromosome segregation protein Spo0J
MAKIVSIATSNLIAPQYLLRTHADPAADYIIERMTDLEANGQISPISVWRNADGTYTHGDGSCRIFCVNLLAAEGRSVKGLEVGTINCVIEGDYTDALSESVFTQQIRANAHMKATASKEYVAAIELLQGEFNHTPAEVQAILGIAPATYYQWLKALSLPEAVRESVASGEISIKKASELKKLLDRDGGEKAPGVIEAAKTLTNEEFSTWCEENKPAKAKSNAVEGFTPKLIMPSKAKLEALYSTGLARGGEFLEAVKIATGLTDEEVAKQKAAYDQAQEDKKKKAE